MSVTQAEPRSSPLVVRYAFGLALIFIFLLALSCRLAYFSQIEHGRLGTPDTPAYEQLGARLHAGSGYSSRHYSGLGGFPAGLTRPPGYPAFLAALSSDPARHQQLTALAQIVLSSLLAVVIAVGTARLITPLAGVAAGVLYALDWTTIVNTPLSIADALLPILIGLGFVLLALALAREPVPRVRLGVAGFCLGLACLVKPAGEVLIVGVLLVLLITVRPRSWVLVFALAVAVPVVPWVVRNQAEYGVFTLSPISTANLYFETALGTEYYRSPITTDLAALSRRLDSADAVWEAKRLSPADRASQLRSRALTIIGRHWPIVLDQAVMGFARTAFGTDAATVKQDWSGSMAPSRLLTTWIPLAEIVIVWGFVAVGVAGAWMSEFVPRRVIVLLVVGIVMALLPAAEPGGYARFRTAAAPMMAMLAGIGAEVVWRRRVIPAKPDERSAIV
jgi:4-amino-4-deoxy-L-arabinose transferase-like glycosyltransferase